jgi:hypothetical protein
MKTSVKITLYIAILLVSGGVLAALYLFNKQHADLQKVKPDFTATASDLQKEFEENETAASSKYVNKIVEISGIVISAKTESDNASSVTLKTQSDFSAVICTFPAAADIAELTAGTLVTIRGECSGFLMDVLLNNCVLIK